MNSKKKKSGKKKRIQRAPSIAKDESYTDFLCPICLQILIEPVQLPCQHELCMACFKMHVENTSLQCPMCRLRISIWVRKNTKTNTLINVQRWELIKSLFPERVERRINGCDDLESSYTNYAAPKHIIASEGEVRKEYEEELKKIEAERAEANKANLAYIEELVAEDTENRKLQEQLDETAAQALQKQEMEHLGVTLKSPSAHQKALLALWKPKSPMKLRDKTVVSNKKDGKKKKEDKLTSPNHTITSFFKSNATNSTQTLNKQSFLETNTPRRSSPRFASKQSPFASTTEYQDSDFDYAQRLQERFNKEMNYASPLNNFSIESSSKVLGKTTWSNTLSTPHLSTLQNTSKLNTQIEITSPPSNIPTTPSQSTLQTESSLKNSQSNEAKISISSSIHTINLSKIETLSPSRSVKRKKPLRQNNSSSVPILNGDNGSKHCIKKSKTSQENLKC